MMTNTLEFWKGKQGDAYVERNSLQSDAHRERVLMWQQILANCYPNHPSSILDIGANVGRNVYALSKISTAELFAVEPNAIARNQLNTIMASDRVHAGDLSHLPFPDNSMDMTFTCGVLIHVSPDQLLKAYAEMYRVTKRWIVNIEYFSARPEMIEYRGEKDKLWKRDFGQLWIDEYKDFVRPVHCGFEWKAMTKLDNLTWWVMEKIR